MESSSNYNVENLGVVKKQLTNSIFCFIRGLPYCLFIPLYLWLINPSTTSGVFAIGSIISFITAILFVNSEYKETVNNFPAGFLGNNISAYGITIGFIGGYKMMENVFKYRLGNVLSSFLMTIIAGILVSWGLHWNTLNEVPVEIANTLLGIIIGGVIGGFCAYVIYYIKKENKKEEEKTKLVCKTLENDNVIDEQII